MTKSIKGGESYRPHTGTPFPSRNAIPAMRRLIPKLCSRSLLLDPRGLFKYTGSAHAELTPLIIYKRKEGNLDGICCNQL